MECLQFEIIPCETEGRVDMGVVNMAYGGAGISAKLDPCKHTCRLWIAM